MSTQFLVNEMDYLASPIREELLSRIHENNHQNNHQWQNLLLIDFDEDQAFIRRLPATQVQFASLLTDKKSLDFGRFPTLGVDDNCLDCVIILCQMAWFDFNQVINQVFRILKPNGVFYFSTLGPDTLIELQNLFNKVDDFPHIHQFVDMHHLGDQLLRTGFSKPILDVDRLKVGYPDIGSLFFDLKMKNLTNHHPDRRKTLMGKNRYLKLLEVAEQQPKIEMTFEIVYGFAQKPDVNQSIKVSSPRLNA